MDAKPPSGISPNSVKIIKKLFNQWKNNLYEVNILNTILTDNHVFIGGINQIPIKFFGECKIYTEYGSLKYQGGYAFKNYHGYGNLFINNNESYEGEFVDGIYDGRGTYYWKNGNVKFVGNWKNNKRHGKGKIYENNSLIFNGMWKDNHKNGIGQEFENGSLIFDGIWKNDKKNGYGKEYDDVENLIKEGIWEENKFIKEITDDDLCIICFQENRSIAFLPCGHFCICLSCSNKYKDKKCLVCRKQLKKKQRIFM
jgi:antitoxin component YwqK of YwqJK toxin-antitoxin module